MAWASDQLLRHLDHRPDLAAHLVRAYALPDRRALAQALARAAITQLPRAVTASRRMTAHRITDPPHEWQASPFA